MPLARVVVTLAAAFSCAFAASGEAPSGPPSGVELPGFSPAERALELALADLSAMADNLALLKAGKIDEAVAVERLRNTRAHIKMFRLDWRDASPEGRAAARRRQADQWRRIEARYAAGVAAFDAQPAPRSVKLGALLNGQSPLAEFAREPPIETFSGILRSGFEASAFQALDGRGPYWLIADGEPWEQIRAVAPKGGGRGSFMTVALEIEGWLEDALASRYDHLGAYEAELHVESVRAVRALSSEQYEAILESVLRAAPAQ